MTIHYEYATHCIITLDNEFTIDMGACNLDTAVSKARWAINEYNFCTADIIDSTTGEVLVTIKND